MIKDNYWNEQDTLNAIIDKAETSVEHLLQQYESKHNKKEFADAFARLKGD